MAMCDHVQHRPRAHPVTATAELNHRLGPARPHNDTTR